MDVLGEGGSGIVYDARWGHREVALKVLHPLLVATPRDRDQFLAEARRLAEIHHAGVVKVLAVGEAEDGRPFLAMEKLRGETLAARLGRGPLPVAQALELFGQLGDAVAALHARGLVHRDLKPENVVLVEGADGREHAVLLDFGIAKELASPASTTTQDGGVRGTPAYMAPERFFGQPASVATDVYELAVTLFAMLAGRLPWDDCADPEVRLDPRRLADLAPHVPAAVDLEVRRALSTRAQNRPASASELRTAVMNAAGIQWTPRHTVDVKSGPIVLPPIELAPPAAPAGPDLALAQTVNLHGPGLRPRRRTGGVVIAFAAVAVTATGIGVAAHYLAKPGDAIEPARPERATAAPPAPAASAPPSGFVRPADAPAPAVSATDQAIGIAHLPDDELFAFGVRVAELDRDETLRPLSDLFGKSTVGIALRAQANLGACSFDVRGRTDWIVVAGPPGDGEIDLIASGRWTRAEVEECLRAATEADAPEAVNDAITTLHGRRGDRVVGWLDDHTFVLSSRPTADVAWMTARLADTTAPEGRVGPLVREVDTTGTAWFAGDQVGGKRISLPEEGEMTGLWGSLHGTLDEVSMDVHVRYPDAKTAEAQRLDLEKTAATMGMDASMGHVDIAQEPDRPETLHVTMGFSRMIAAILIEAVASGSLPQ